MRKLFGLFVALAFSFAGYSQDSTVVDPPVSDSVIVVDTLPITDPTTMIEETTEENESRQRNSKLSMAQLAIAGRSKDHLLIQLGIDNWANKPDNINTRLSRSFSMYMMFDFPFKSNPHLSVAIGAGVSTSNIYFKNTYIDIAGKNSTQLTFTDVSDTTRFKKFKLMTTYLEAPVEFRYTKNPVMPKKSFKAAIGVKVGTMLGATTKGKTLLNGAGNTINAYTQKEKSKRFFNTTRIAATARAGIGSFSVFGTYQLNAFIKEGFGPDVRPYAVGITLSGL